MFNYLSEKAGRGKLSLSKKIKNSVKSAVKFINDFEQIAAEIAISNEYHYVICGHIHQPEIRKIEGKEGEVIYMNSGDWIENLTALEYNEGNWSLYQFYEDHQRVLAARAKKFEEVKVNNNELFENLVRELNFVKP
jgi:UDP-2,3-diacylglucosamine pyrophosphatase LpxH